MALTIADDNDFMSLNEENEVEEDVPEVLTANVREVRVNYVVML